MGGQCRAGRCVLAVGSPAHVVLAGRSRLIAHVGLLSVCYQVCFIIHALRLRIIRTAVAVHGFMSLIESLHRLLV